MAHARQQIRERFITLLTGLTTTGSNVFKGRVYPHGSDNVPGWNVRNGADRLVPDQDTLGKRQMYEFQCLFEGRSKPAYGTELDDQLDTMAAEAQAIIMADPTLGDLVMHCELTDTEFDTFGSQERPVGIIRQRWAVRYFIFAEDPETLIYQGG
jgi:hypothetical protein